MTVDAKILVSDSSDAIAMSEQVFAVVKWFRPDKGYGFVGLDDGGGDAFLHVKALRSLRLDAAPAGATLRVELEQGLRGRQVKRVLEFDASTAHAGGGLARPGFPGAAPAAHDGADATELTGKVKWFDDVRGFGFVASDDFGRDVFVHCSIFGRSGIERLLEGQSVTMQVIETPKGRQAVEISV